MASSGDKLEALDLSSEEMERLGRAFKDERFKQLFREYAEEISDPENRRLYEQEIRMMEQERGMDAKFVHPQPGHVLRTSKGGRQRCYVNVCSNPLMGQPGCKPAQGGQQWSLPYSLSPGREDLAKGSTEKHMIYDVVFHPDTLRMADSNRKFKEIVDSTALEGVEKQFGVTLDKRNVKTLNVKYKGAPHATVLRTPIPGVTRPQGQDPNDPLRFPYPYEKGDGTSSKADQHSSKRKDPKPQTSQEAPTEPYFTITQRSYVDLQDYRHSRDAVPSPVPKELLVTIDLPLLESASDATLDIHERLLSLESQTPAYSLRVTLPYPVDEALGSAKFNKAKRQLLVTLPVVVQKCQGLANTSLSNADADGTSTSETRQLVEELDSKGDCEENTFQEPRRRQESSQIGQPFTAETEDGAIEQPAKSLGDNENGNPTSSDDACVAESEDSCVAEVESTCVGQSEGLAEPEGLCVSESGASSVSPLDPDSLITAVSGKIIETFNSLTLPETENIMQPINHFARDSHIQEHPSEPCSTVHYKDRVPVSEEKESRCPNFQCTQDDASVTLIINVPQIDKETFKSEAGTSHCSICFTSEDARMFYSLVFRFNIENTLNPNEVTVCIAKHNAVLELTKAPESCGLWEKCSFGVDENNLQDWLFVTEENVDRFLDGVVNSPPLERPESEIQPVIEVVEVTDKSSHFRLKEPVTKNSDGKEQSINNADHSKTESAVRVHPENNIATKPADRPQTEENGKPSVSVTHAETMEKAGHGSQCSQPEPGEPSLPLPEGGRTTEPEVQTEATASKCATPCHGAKQRGRRFKEQAELQELDEDDVPDVGSAVPGGKSAVSPPVQEINPEDGSVHVITDHTTRCAFSFQNTLIYDLD